MNDKLGMSGITLDPFQRQAQESAQFDELKRLRAENEKLREALRKVSMIDMYGTQRRCFCEYGIGHPAYSRHSDACRFANEALTNVGKPEEGK